MRNLLILAIAAEYVPAFDNSALVPELWAQEALMQLEANMVMGNLVHRDFEPTIAKFGDTVNAHRPQERNATRKAASGDAIVSTDATTDNVPVVLNQHIYDSFIIKDGEESMSFRDLVNLHLIPTAQGMAQFIDQLLCGQVYRFIGANNVGSLGTAISKTTMTQIREKANALRWPTQGRNFVMSPSMEQALLDTDLFVSAEKVGDDGTALREGSLGRKFGLNTFMDQNAPSIATGNTVVTGAVNQVGGYAAGVTTLTVDGLAAAIPAGTWCTIAGDMTPQRITATVGGGTPTQLTISPGLQHAVANDAVITIYTAGAINLLAGYSAGYGADLTVDGFSVAPKVGQLISLGTNYHSSLTSRISPATTSVMLDRPIAADVANDAVVGIGPAGNYGFVFHRNATGFVSRPLALPRAGVGALGYVASYNGMSMRAVITYDGAAQGHRVTLDMLAGVAQFDSRLGFPVYG